MEHAVRRELRGYFEATFGCLGVFRFIGSITAWSRTGGHFHHDRALYTIAAILVSSFISVGGLGH